MPVPEIHPFVESALAADHPGPFHWQTLGQGVGDHAWRVNGADESWFVKIAADEPQMLAAETDGLKALADCQAVRVPGLVVAGDGFLVTQWLDFGHKTQLSASRLGAQLARQHRNSDKRFGWRRDNFIGATPQFNTLRDDWIEFFREQRLGFQLRLAAENGYRGVLQERGARLLGTLPSFFGGYTPQPSLLHGDLWGGNWGALATGEPVIFDPAVYYGDREADLAMTELFGGFPAEFYSAYNSAWPLDVGYPVRRDLYNLYHVLNHLNLFGERYMQHVERILTRVLTAARRPPMGFNG